MRPVAAYRGYVRGAAHEAHIETPDILSSCFTQLSELSVSGRKGTNVGEILEVVSRVGAARFEDSTSEVRPIEPSVLETRVACYPELSQRPLLHHLGRNWTSRHRRLICRNKSDAESRDEFRLLASFGHDFTNLPHASQVLLSFQRHITLSAPPSK
jgi:hypothetical protein